VIEFALSAAAFVSGIVLCIQALASLYAVIDHGYAFNRRIAAGIAAWCTIFAGLGYCLSEPFGTAYWLGAACSVAVHLFIATLAVVLPQATRWWDEIEYRRLLKEEARRSRATVTERKGS
jgi:hypothetical protein